MQAMARSWFDDGRIAFGVFYIDEHFLPYYGVKKLDEGWFSSHKKIQKGSYQYFVTDEAHNPVFFLLTDANERLVQLVPRVMDELKQTAGDSSKGKKMTLVFDRGGCSVPLFRQVTEAGAHFITYVENSDELGFPSEKIVWAEATLQFKKKSRVYRISDCCGTYRNFPRARIIGVWNLKTGKRTFVVSSDHDRPANEIANLMLGRWGQENFIKVMKHDLHIDHFPGYDYLGYKDREVNNPEHIRLRNEKAALTTQIKQAKQKLAEAQLKNPSQTRTREKKAVELQELCAKVTDLLEEKKALSRQQRALSAKIPLSQTPDAQRMSRLDFERKAIVDVLKLTVYMAWRSLEKKLAPHYRRNDIHQVVKMIASRGASLRLENDTLHCQLKHFDQPSVHRATEALCGELNQLKAHTPDKWRFKIQFSVSPRPTGRNSGLRLSRGS
jgi:hypothetical protein